MKRVLILAAAVAAAALAGVPADAQDRNLLPIDRQDHQHEHDHDRDDRPPGTGRVEAGRREFEEHEHRHGTHGRPPGRVADPTAVIRQRADTLANEIEYIQEHLGGDLEGHVDPGMRRLFAQADGTLREAIHFRRSVQNDAPPQEVYEHFRTLDGQVHALIQAIQATDDATLRRASSRLAYADEQLHAIVARGSGQTSTDLIARQAHVLAGEAQRLERAARITVARQDRHQEGDHRGDPQMLDALRAFADRVEHFHETAENESDLRHLAEDFAAVDQSWHQVVDLMNRNPHSAYFYRRAERVDSMHHELRRVLGLREDRPVIRFEAGGIGVDLGR